MCFYPQTINASEIVINLPNADFEMCCFDAQCNHTVIRFITVYCPPNYNCVTELVRSLRDLSRTWGPCLISGDCSCPGIDWENLIAPHDGLQEDILDFVITAGLIQLGNQPTRGNNTLDVILAREPLAVCIQGVAQPFSSSNHSQVEFYCIHRRK